MINISHAFISYPPPPTFGTGSTSTLTTREARLENISTGIEVIRSGIRSPVRRVAVHAVPRWIVTKRTHISNF